MEEEREKYTSKRSNVRLINKKACSLAVLAAMSTFSANASEFIIQDGKVIEGTYSGNTDDAGGAFYNKAQNVIFQNIILENNSSNSTNEHMGDGGAIRNGSKDEKATIKYIQNATFKGNTAVTNGGAISLAGTDCIIKEGIINTVFSGNKSTYKIGSGEDATHGQGGAICAIGGILGNGIKGCTFTNNSSTLFGGAIVSWDNITGITDSKFEGNTSEDGGALGVVSKIDKISNTSFTKNVASRAGGAIYVDISADEKHIGDIQIISNVKFTNNTVKSSAENTVTGGAIVNGSTIKEIKDSTFTGNSTNNAKGIAGYGGAIYNYDVLNKISNSTFEKNSSEYGGAIYNSSQIDSIENSTFTSNKAEQTGGAINHTSANNLLIKNSYFNSNVIENSEEINQTVRGGAINNDFGHLTVINSEFSDNKVISHNGDAAGSAISSTASATITDTSFFNNKNYNKQDITYTSAIELNGLLEVNPLKLNIYAKDKNVVFDGNTSTLWDENEKEINTVKSDITMYNTEGNFNATKNKSITFGGRVYNVSDNININNEEGYTGDVIFNNEVIAPEITVYRGTMRVGKSDKDKSNLNTDKLISNGGTIDIANDYIENVYLQVLDYEADGDVLIDADLSTNSIDAFVVTDGVTGNGNIRIKNLHLLSDNYSDNSSLKFIRGADVSSNVKVPTLFTSTDRYDASVVFDSSDTIINLEANKGDGGLNNMTDFTPASSGSGISYTMTQDEKIDKDLTPFNENVIGVYISGNGHSVTANNAKGFELSNGQELEINDIKSFSGFKSQNGAVIYNNGGNATIARTAFDNNSAAGNGGAIYTTTNINLIDTSFTGNNAGGKGGAIYATKGANVTINANTQDVIFSNNKANAAVNDIYMDNDGDLQGGTLSLNTNSGTKISLSSVSGSNKGYRIAINENATNADGIVEVKGNISNAIANGGINLYSGTLKLNNDSNINNNSLSMHGGTLDIINNKVSALSLNELNLSNNNNIKVDVDLANKNIDRIKASSIKANGTLNVTDMNVISDSKYKNTTIKFTGPDFKNEQLSSHIKNSVKEVKGPIYKYNVNGFKDGSDYNFTFSNKNGHGEVEYNPSVFVTPAALELGGYANQLALYQAAFGSTDMINFMTKEQRNAYLQANKLAYSNTAANNITYTPTNLPVGENGGIWTKPGAAFEKVNFKNGPEVKNFMYNMLIGGDSGLRDYGGGWSGIVNGYTGYIGSHQSFDDVSMYQNGGVIGFSGMLYKNNFFGGLTANIAMSGVDANYDMGKENFGLLSTGAAGKFGYNWGLANGKLIIQPNVTASYSYVNAFNHNNSLDQEITSNGLHGIQISPGLKIIGNLKNNWQPYVGANFMWNIMGKTDTAIEGVDIPGISIKPYIQYSVGVQKKLGKRFTGYAEFMGRNIGRTGFAFGLGGRWELGSDKPKNEANNVKTKPQTQINSYAPRNFEVNKESETSNVIPYSNTTPVQNVKPSSIVNPNKQLNESHTTKPTVNNFTKPDTTKKVKTKSKKVKKQKQDKYSQPVKQNIVPETKSFTNNQHNDVNQQIVPVVNQSYTNTQHTQNTQTYQSNYAPKSKMVTPTSKPSARYILPTSGRTSARIY